MPRLPSFISRHAGSIPVDKSQQWIREVRRWLGENAYRVSASASDETPGYLEDKIVAGSNVTITEADGQLVVASTGGTFAPTDAQYHVLAAHADLTQERVDVYQPIDFLTVDGGAGNNYTIDLKRIRWGFYEAVTYWTSNTPGDKIAELNAGSGASFAHQQVAGRFGVTRCTLTTSATARGGFITTQTNAIAFYIGEGRFRWETAIRIQQLSNSTDGYRVRCGFMQSNALAIFDGVYLQYEDDINSGKWQLAARCDNNAADTATQNLNMTVAIDKWYYISLDVNAAGTSVTATVIEDPTGSPVTETATLALTPGTTGPDIAEPMGIGSYMYNTSGTGAGRTFDCDYVTIQGIQSVAT